MKQARISKRTSSSSSRNSSYSNQRQHGTKYNNLSDALNSISGGNGNLGIGMQNTRNNNNKHGSSSRGIRVQQNNRRLNVNNNSVNIRNSRRIPRQQRSRLPVSPLDRHRQKGNQVMLDQRMTSAPEPSSSRRSMRNRSMNNNINNNNNNNNDLQQLRSNSSSSKHDNNDLLPRPSSRQRSSRSRKRGSSMNNNSNRMHGFVNNQLETKKQFPTDVIGGEFGLPFDNKNNSGGISSSASFAAGGGNGGGRTKSNNINNNGNSKDDDVTNFLNSWNKIGRPRPNTSDRASRIKRQNNARRSKGLGQTSARNDKNNNKKNLLVSEDMLIISMSPISIKAKSKDDIFRLGDFDKNVIVGTYNHNNNNNDDSNAMQLPSFGGYPSNNGKNIYYGNDTNNSSNNVGAKLNQNNQILHTQLLQPPSKNEEIFVRNLPKTARAGLDGRPVSRGRFRSSRGLPYGIPAVSNRRARTSVGRSRRSKMSDPNGFSPSMIKRSRPSTSGGY